MTVECCGCLFAEDVVGVWACGCANMCDFANGCASSIIRTGDCGGIGVRCVILGSVPGVFCLVARW